MAWTGYRAGRVAGGGALNGHYAPSAKQAWEMGATVSVGFVKNLLVVHKTAGGAYALLQIGTGRWYRFQPHGGLVRCDSERAARAA